MGNTTVIYYTSNREKEDFETKIRERLLKAAGRTPLISVSQKPIDFGENICVGDVGISDHNIYRQIQLGCLKATTKFVCTAEADCLYPSAGYFDFAPPDKETAYHYTNVWILYKGTHIFKKKAYSLCALFANREYLLSRLDRVLHKLPKWSLKKPHPLFHRYQGWTPFTNELAVVNIKTKDGMRWFTGTEEKEAKSLPFWGSAKHLEGELWPKK
ncbi:MAG TPA: hypothetical protein VJ227_01515 [Patescibacteria group bacterium]|nr:hypothetical protein [Patescibacteria group bacterium]